MWVLPAILAVAAVNFFWRLGTSSYYVDEALSIEHSLPPISEVIDIVRATETTPFTFSVGLNQWLYHGGSQDEFDARLPQVIAGIALVAAIYWMARAFVDRKPALLAAGLAAVSPFVLMYAQQVRVYVWMMLAIAIAVGATVRGGRWLWLGGAAAAAALLLHYMASFVIAPLLVWLALRRDVAVRARVAFAAVCLAAWGVLLPYFIDQYRAAPDGGDLADADLTASPIIRLLSTPFDGRWTAEVDWLRIFGLVAVLGALAAVWRFGAERVREHRLLVVLALAPPLALIAAGVLGKEILITRYAAGAAPLMLTALAAALVLLPRPAAVVVAVAAAVGTVGGLVRSHGSEGRYPPSREVVEYIAADSRPGDWWIIPGNPTADIALGFYTERRILPLPIFMDGTKPADVEHAFDSADRIWIVRSSDDEPPSEERLLELARPSLESVGFEPVKARGFDTSATFVVVLAERRN